MTKKRKRSSMWSQQSALTPRTGRAEGGAAAERICDRLAAYAASLTTCLGSTIVLRMAGSVSPHGTCSSGLTLAITRVW